MVPDDGYMGPLFFFSNLSLVRDGETESQMRRYG